ncbi:hypothetical protein, partial [Micromonospora sp. NPDC005367]|uniref:hypothetical protein n=1 Tax=Micromonospora sp. NPDC005367 TaxID=3155590 RepID=UPI0033B0DA03
INVPIRTVLFTGLSKYDGVRTRLLKAREFHLTRRGPGLQVRTPSTDRNVGLSYPHQPQPTASGARIAYA